MTHHDRPRDPFAPRISRRDWLGRTGAAALSASWALGCGTYVRQASAADNAGKGSKLLVGGNIREDETLRGLFLVDPEAGTWRRVVDGYVVGGRLSPDGRTVAFRRIIRDENNVAVQSVWLCDAETGENLRKLAEPAFSALWAPDGQKLLVNSIVNAQSREKAATLMRPDGSEPKKLDIPSREYAMDWSTDGEWLLTLADPGNAQRDPNTYARRLDGLKTFLLAENSRYPMARFVPGSEQVSLLRPEKDKPQCLSLWLAECDGTGMRKLIDGKPELFPFTHCWSPDGKQLAVEMIHTEMPDENTISTAPRQIQRFTAEGQPGPKLELPHLRPMPLDWK